MAGGRGVLGAVLEVAVEGGSLAPIQGLAGVSHVAEGRQAWVGLASSRLQAQALEEAEEQSIPEEGVRSCRVDDVFSAAVARATGRLEMV